MTSHEPLTRARTIHSQLVATDPVEIRHHRDVAQAAKTDCAALATHEPLRRARPEHSQHVPTVAGDVEQRHRKIARTTEANSTPLPRYEPLRRARAVHRQNVTARAVVVPKRDRNVLGTTKGVVHTAVTPHKPLTRARTVDRQ